MGGVTYYAKLGFGASREAPSGIVRRRVVDGLTYDESFNRNRRWEPTEYLALHALGYDEIDYAEITEEEADEFIKGISVRGASED